MISEPTIRSAALISNTAEGCSDSPDASTPASLISTSTPTSAIAVFAVSIVIVVAVAVVVVVVGKSRVSIADEIFVSVGVIEDGGLVLGYTGRTLLSLMSVMLLLASANVEGVTALAIWVSKTGFLSDFLDLFELDRSKTLRPNTREEAEAVSLDVFVIPGVVVGWVVGLGADTNVNAKSLSGVQLHSISFGANAIPTAAAAAAAAWLAGTDFSWGSRTVAIVLVADSVVVVAGVDLVATAVA